MINLLVKLANNLDKKGFFSEADRLDSIISFAANNRLFGLKDDSSRMNIGSDNMLGEMLKLSQLVAEKLDLHAPMFLGSGMSAFAFSASNDEGENVVMKIMPESDADNYKILMNNQSIQTSVMPVVYRVEKLSNLNIEDSNSELSEDIRNKIFYDSVVVMEELEPMPPQLTELLMGRFDEKENFRLFMQSDEYKNMKKNFIEVASKEISTRFGLDNNIIKNIIDKCLQAFRVLNETIHTRVSHFILKFIDTMERIIDELNYEDKTFQANRVEILSVLNESQENFIYRLNEIIYENWHVLDRAENINVRGKEDIIKQLNKLKELGIVPVDVHRYNIMIRPSTGELVVGDIGNFYME